MIITNVKYQQIYLFTRNIHVKYKNCSFHCLKFITRLKFSRSNSDSKVRVQDQQAFTVTWVSETSFQKSSYLYINSPIILLMKINNAASFSLNTIAINVLYIDRIEENTYSLLWLIWPCPNIRILAQPCIFMTLTTP